MLRSWGDRGREAAGDGPGPEGGRDPPRNLDGTNLRRSLSSVAELNLSLLACEFAVPFLVHFNIKIVLDLIQIGSFISD